MLRILRRLSPYSLYKAKGRYAEDDQETTMNAKANPRVSKFQCGNKDQKT